MPLPKRRTSEPLPEPVAAIDPAPGPVRSMPLLWVAAVIALVMAGMVLRCTWTADMEFKGDESWMFQTAMTAGRTEPWPMLGMPSGGGINNPPLSAWVFSGLQRLSRARTPLQLDRAVVALNVLALLAIVVFALRVVPRRDREVWFWAAAFAAASPIGLVLERKIWAQSTLPLFCVICLWGWWRRDTRPGALVWGCFAALLGQIHMSGFFFSAAFFLATVIFQLLGRSPRPTPLGKKAKAALTSQVEDPPKRARWILWFLGSLLGSVSLIPWLKYVAGGARGEGWSWENVKSLQFFGYWVNDMLGLGLDYSLGPHFDAFLSYPSMKEWLKPGQLLQQLEMGGLVATGAVAVALAIAHRAEWRKALAAARRPSDTVIAAFAGIFLFGGMITAAGIDIYRHYLIVMYPLATLPVILIASKWRPLSRWLLLAMCLGQLGLSASFLSFIHENGGAIGGDYGRAYRGE